MSGPASWPTYDAGPRPPHGLGARPEQRRLLAGRRARQRRHAGPTSPPASRASGRRPATGPPATTAGTEYPVFVHVLGRGDADTQTFTIHNDRPRRCTVNVTLGADRVQPVGSNDYSFTTLDRRRRRTAAFPDAGLPDPDRRGHPGRDGPDPVRVARPYDQFDPAHDSTRRSTSSSSTSRTGPIATATASSGTTPTATARSTSARPTRREQRRSPSTARSGRPRGADARPARGG